MTVDVMDWDEQGDAMQNFVVSTLALTDEKVVWGHQSRLSQPDYPFAVLTLSGMRMIGHAELRKDENIMVDVVTIVNAVEQLYTVTVDGTAYEHDADDTDTVTDIRDALQALVAGGESDVFVGASGIDAFTITGSSARLSFHTTVLPAVDITRVSTTDAICERVYWPAEVTLSVDVRSDQTVPRLGSRTLAERLPIGAHQGSNFSLFKAARIAFWRVAGITDLTGLVSGDMESRTVADLIFGLSPQAAENLSFINTINTTPVWT